MGSQTAMSATVTGGDQLARELAALGQADKREFRAAIRRDMRQQIAVLREAARAGAPMRTGRLRRAIKVKAWTHPAAGEIGVKLIINRGVSRDDTGGAYYGWMIEFGRILNGRYLAGRYMLTHAYEQHGQAAADAVSDGILRAAKTIIG